MNWQLVNMDEICVIRLLVAILSCVHKCLLLGDQQHPND